VEVSSIPKPTPASGEKVEHADLLVAVLTELDLDSLTTLCDGLRALPGAMRIAVALKDAYAIPPENPSENMGNGSHLAIIPWASIGLDIAMPSISAGYQSIFSASTNLEARACCIVTSKLENGSTQWVSQFVRPVVEADFDLVTPYYARHKLEGLMNSAIVAPLGRSLYGKRIQNPMGPDLATSQKLFQRILESDPQLKQKRVHPLASLAPLAACGNLKVCQVHLGARTYPSVDWTNTSLLLVEVLGPIFLDMERNAVCWQRVRESLLVPVFGEPFAPSTGAGAVDVDQLVNSFQLGVRDLQEIWGLVLPPASLFELRKLARLASDQFAMPDELWVRVVYDFALAHRLRTINRDHLLRSMTPLYLGWVASHAREVANADAAAIEKRLDRLAATYEGGKSYLVSRWRWPDRFNP
jgi:glucosylglycerate synthase